jgi:hypothetical protein
MSVFLRHIRRIKCLILVPLLYGLVIFFSVGYNTMRTEIVANRYLHKNLKHCNLFNRCWCPHKKKHEQPNFIFA